MREEAINAIVGYFGNVNPGSVGWCTGTNYHTVRSKDGQHVCQPEFPLSVQQIPWLHTDGLGYDHCPE